MTEEVTIVKAANGYVLKIYSSQQGDSTHICAKVQEVYDKIETTLGWK